MFPDSPLVREMQAELNLLIQDGIHRITYLLRAQVIFRNFFLCKVKLTCERFFRNIIMIIVQIILYFCDFLIYL